MSRCRPLRKACGWAISTEREKSRFERLTWKISCCKTNHTGLNRSTSTACRASPTRPSRCIWSVRGIRQGDESLARAHRRISERRDSGPGGNAGVLGADRRLGFEHNGMVLHEYYFENLTPQPSLKPESSSSFLRWAEASFGSYDRWKPISPAWEHAWSGVGHLLSGPASGRLTNHWITLHESGNVAGFIPFSSWTCGNTHSSWTTLRPRPAATSTPFSRMSSGGQWTGASRKGLAGKQRSS